MLSALLLANTLDILILSILARKFGISVRGISLGWGPTLYQHGIFKLKLIPLSACVQLKDSRQEDCLDTTDAFNHQAVWKQLVVNLLPLLIALCLGIILFGQQGYQSFYISFYQITTSTLAPFSTAQDYLDGFKVFASQHSILEVYGLVLIKSCAFNLLPLPGTRGWMAFLQLSSMGKPQVKWQDWISMRLSFISLLMLIVWLIIFIYWGYRYLFS